MNYLHPVGPFAKAADDLWRLTFGIAAVVFVLVEGGLLFVLFRYRQRSEKDSPKQIHGNTRLEVIWTLIPTFILAAIVAPPTVQGILKISAEPPKDSLAVKVTAHQWWWEFKYLNGPQKGLVTANELHIPLNKPVDLRLYSQDVIHSFWVPKLSGKQDVVPGRINRMTIESPQAGVFRGQCAEFCGLSHANMRFRVFAEAPADFASWAEGQLSPAASPSDSLAAHGQDLFVNGACAGCHSIKGTAAQGMVGPNLTHLASRTTFAGGIFDLNENNLKAWLTNPPERKPGSKMPNLHLKQDDIEALVSFLQTLK